MSNEKKQKRFSETELEMLLASLDEQSDLEAGPFFYAKVKNRLAQRETQSSSIFTLLFARPVYGFATLVVMLILNLVTVFAADTSTAITREEGIETIADQYNVDLSQAVNNSEQE